MAPRFWETKKLEEMNADEWDSLCDRCGKCCLHKLIDEDTNDIFYTRVACSLLDPNTLQCASYSNRFFEVKDCLDVKKMTSTEMSWMPRTCAYRLIMEGKALPRWHPLITEKPTDMECDERSIRGKVVSEKEVDIGSLQTEIITWIEA